MEDYRKKFLKNFNKLNETNIDFMLDALIENAKTINSKDPAIIFEGSESYPVVKENNYDLIIKNNGDVLNEPITPGSGLRLMKKKVAAQGGTLNILQKPVFTLLITIPGGETDA